MDAHPKEHYGIWIREVAALLGLARDAEEFTRRERMWVSLWKDGSSTVQAAFLEASGWLPPLSAFTCAEPEDD